MRISAPSSRVQSTSSGFRICTSPTVLMSPAVTAPGPVLRSVMRFAPSLCILMAIVFTLRTMSVTSSRTPGMDENSCSTPSIWTAVTAAPWSDDRRARRSELPSVVPKPRSSGSATTVAMRFGSSPGATSSLFGLISSCQFFWITTTPHEVRLEGRFWTSPLNRNARGWRPTRRITLDAATLARAAAIVRDRRHVTDRGDGEAGRLQGAQSGLTAGAGTRHLDLEGTHAVLGSLAGRIFSGDLRRIRGRLTRTLETHGAGRGPGDRVALGVGDGDHGVVERGVHVRHAGNDVLAFATADAGSFFSHSIDPSSAPVMPGAREIRATRQGWPQNLTSSCRRSASPCPCGCGRWCGCAGRGPAGCGG